MLEREIWGSGARVPMPAGLHSGDVGTGQRADSPTLPALRGSGQRRGGQAAAAGKTSLDPTYPSSSCSIISRCFTATTSATFLSPLITRLEVFYHVFTFIPLAGPGTAIATGTSAPVPPPHAVPPALPARGSSCVSCTGVVTSRCVGSGGGDAGLVLALGTAPSRFHRGAGARPFVTGGTELQSPAGTGRPHTPLGQSHHGPDPGHAIAGPE